MTGRVARVSLWVAAIVIVLLVVGEAGAFFALRAHLIVPLGDSATPWLPKDLATPLAVKYWREHNASLGYDYLPFIVWRHVPYNGEMIVVDNDGLRRTSHAHCERNAYTIWMFGGSTMWGSGSPDWETIPSFLAGEYVKGGRQVCVRNYGESGWVSTQEVIELMLELKRAQRKPDLVIFYDGVNDVTTAWQFGTPYAHDDLPLIKRFVENREKLKRGSFAYILQTNTLEMLRVLSSRAGFWSLFPRREQRRGQRASGDVVKRLARVTAEYYFQNVAIVKDLAQGYGFQYRFFWQPVVFVGQKPLTPDEVMIRDGQILVSPGLDTMHQLTYDLVQAAKLPHLFYIADVFDNRSDTIYIDWAHVSAEGNRLVATRMYEILRQQAL